MSAIDEARQYDNYARSRMRFSADHIPRDAAARPVIYCRQSHISCWLRDIGESRRTLSRAARYYRQPPAPQWARAAYAVFHCHALYHAPAIRSPARLATTARKVARLQLYALAGPIIFTCS